MRSELQAAVAWLTRINRAAASLAGAAILLMMLVGAADVIMTNLNLFGFASRPIPATTEFMATMMVVAVFLGLSLAQQRRSHIQMDVSQFAGPAVRRPLEALHHLSHGLLYGLIAAFGWSAAGHAFEVGEFAAGAYDFPIWPARLILAAGASLMTVQCAVDLAAVFLPALRIPQDDVPVKPNTI